MIRKLIDTLAAILDDAIEGELIDRNPARGKRIRVRVPMPPRTFLEMNELAAGDHGRRRAGSRAVVAR